VLSSSGENRFVLTDDGKSPDRYYWCNPCLFHYFLWAYCFLFRPLDLWPLFRNTTRTYKRPWSVRE
jgi:hypothetical protein